jgi:cytochrome c
MSLVTGMSQRTFLSVAMAGKQDKGMPSWAGFLSQEDMIKVYRYVKGRSLDLVPSGRPSSE